MEFCEFVCLCEREVFTLNKNQEGKGDQTMKIASKFNYWIFENQPFQFIRFMDEEITFWTPFK